MPPEPLRCAGALIVDDEGRIFVQRRAAGQKLFPNAWDIAGGHVEPGESLEDALRREVAEETGWTVSHVLGVVSEHQWSGPDGRTRVETDFLVRVEGDLARPRLRAAEHTEFRWLAADETAVLTENRAPDDPGVRPIVEGGFAALRSIGL